MALLCFCWIVNVVVAETVQCQRSDFSAALWLFKGRKISNYDKQLKILHLSFQNISTHFTSTFHVCRCVTKSSVKWESAGRHSADVKQNIDIPFLMPFLFHHRTFVLYVIKAVLRRKTTCPRYPMLPPIPLPPPYHSGHPDTILGDWQDNARVEKMVMFVFTHKALPSNFQKCSGKRCIYEKGV